MKLLFTLMVFIFSLAAGFAHGESIEKIEVGDFRVEYQAAGPSRSISEAKAKCAALEPAGAWRLSKVEDFIGTLMMGHQPFAAFDQPNEPDAKVYLAWVDVDLTDPRAVAEGFTPDTLMSIRDGSGLSSESVPLAATIAQLESVLRTVSTASGAPLENDHILFGRALLGALKPGVAGVCFRDLPKEE